MSAWKIGSSRESRLQFRSQALDDIIHSTSNVDIGAFVIVLPVIRPHRTYSASAGAKTPFGIRRQTRGFAIEFLVKGAAMVNSSMFSSNDIAAARSTTGSGALTTAMLTSPPVFLAVHGHGAQVAWNQTNDEVIFVSDKLPVEGHVRMPLSSAMITLAEEYRPRSCGQW